MSSLESTPRPSDQSQGLSINDLVVSKAASTYGKLGSEELVVKKGSKKKRLNLSLDTKICTSAKTAANVYVETIGKWGAPKEWFLKKMTGRFARLVLNEGKVIYVNLNSLSKRLGIQKEVILKARDDGTLGQLIQSYSEINKKNEARVAERYQKIIGIHSRDYNEKDISIETATSLTAKTIYKTIGISFGLTQGFHQFIEVDGKKILAKRDSEDQLSMHHSVKYIAEGSFGKVSKVKNIATGEVFAAKIAHNSAHPTRGGNAEQAKIDNQNEYDILHRIHGDTVRRGIQKPPVETINFQDGTVGYIAPFYDNDLFYSVRRTNLDTITVNWDITTLPATVELDCIHQLFCGLDYCSREGIILGDIKEENCLIKEVQTDEGLKYECVLSDFGGARDLSKIGEKEIPGLEWGVGQKETFSKNDIKAFHGARGDSRVITKTLFQRDVYALGKMLRGILKESSNLTKGDQEFFKGLISKMTDENYKTRITIRDALRSLEIFLKERTIKP